MIGPLHEQPGWRGAILKNSRVLRDGDGSPTLRVEVCARRHEPTAWQRLRGDYLVSLVVAAEDMYAALSRSIVDAEGRATIGARDAERLRCHMVRIGEALDALVQHEQRGEGGNGEEEID